MKFKDYILDGVLVNEISSILSLSDEIAKAIKLDLIFKYGEKIILPHIETISKEELSQLITSIHKTKWETLISLELNGLVLGTIKEVDNGSKSDLVKSDNSESKNKVSTIENIDLIIDSGSDNNSNSNQTENRESKTNEIVKDIKNLETNLLILQNVNIISAIGSDIQTYITCPNW